MSGTFQTPDFPLPYSDNTWCRKTVKAAKGSKVDVKVHHMDVEYERSCRYDYLRVNVEAFDYEYIVVSALCVFEVVEYIM